MDYSYARHTQPDLIGSAMLSEYGAVKPSAYLQLSSSIAEEYLRRIHMEVPFLMERYGVSWVLLSSSFVIRRQPLPGQHLRLSTWSSGYQWPVFRREVEICDDRGHCLVSGASFSGVLDLRSRRMVARDDLPEPFCLLKHGPKLLYADSRAEDDPAGYGEVDARTVYGSWIDALGHANNIRYGELVYDALTEPQQRRLGELSRLDLYFQRELRRGDRVRLFRKEQGDQIFVRGLREADGVPAFLAKLSF